MRAIRILFGLFIALLALSSCDGSPIQEPPLQEPPLQEPPPPPVLVLEAVTPLSTTGIVGVALAVAPVILVKQVDGLPVEGIQVSFAVSGSGAVGSATVRTDAGGLATPGSWRLGPAAGPQTLTARAAEHAVVFTADAQPGPITSLTVVGGNHQRAEGGNPLSVPLRVKASDHYGNVVAAEAVTFTVVDGGGSLVPRVSITGADGIAKSTWTLGTTAGRQHVRAGTDAETTVQFTAEACEAGHCSSELAYNVDGNIMVLDVATGGIRQLTTDGLSTVGAPAWSPDGQRIAFARYGVARGDYLEVYVMNPDGTDVTRVTGHTPRGPAWSHSPTWSPQGDAIAFVGDNSLCLYHCAIYIQELSEGSVARRVASWGRDPAWSPDGSRIAFVELYGDDDPLSLRLVNPDGTGLTDVVVRDGWLYGTTWSPDGTRIAFSKCADGGCDIYVVRPDGSDLTQLTRSGCDGWCGAVTPAWSPDGSHIAYVQWSQHSEGRIMMIPADGGEPVTLVAPGYVPSWRP